MRKAIKPHVRSDGVIFIDKEHFIDGSPIHSWICTNKKCGYKTTETSWEKEDKRNVNAHADVTGGFYGPNGNGYNYWCPKCDSRMNPKNNPYNAFKAFMS